MSKKQTDLMEHKKNSQRHSFFEKKHSGDFHSSKSNIRVKFDWDASGKTLFCSAVIGIAGGLSVAVFHLLLHFFMQGIEKFCGYWNGEFWNECSGHPNQIFNWPANPFWLLFIPALGGLLSGLVLRFGNAADHGEGVDASIKAFHQRNGLIRRRIPMIEALASLLSMGTGGSVGKEGPLSMLGSSLASWIARHFHVSAPARRLLLLSGIAAAVGAVIQAPFAGAIFATEVLYSTTAIEFAGIVPCVVAALVSYSSFQFVSEIFAQIFGEAVLSPPLFTMIEPIGLTHSAEIPFLFLLAIFCALWGSIYVKTFRAVRTKIFDRIQLPGYLKAALGGLLLGLLALLFPQVLGSGTEWIQTAATEKMSCEIMLLLIFPKIIAIALTLASGGCGGTFMPTLCLGALVGGSFGHLAGIFLTAIGADPTVLPSPGIFALIGMSGFFAAVIRTPLAAAILVCEITHSYSMIAPLTLVSMTAMILLPQGMTLHRQQVRSWIDSPSHLGLFLPELLVGVQIADLYQPDSEFQNFFHPLENSNKNEKARFRSKNDCSDDDSFNNRNNSNLHENNNFSKNNASSKNSEKRKEEKIPFCLQEKCSIQDAAALIRHRTDTYFPVLDSNEKLVGILSASDLFAVQQSYPSLFHRRSAQKKEHTPKNDKVSLSGKTTDTHQSNKIPTNKSQSDKISDDKLQSDKTLIDKIQNENIQEQPVKSKFLSRWKARILSNWKRSVSERKTVQKMTVGDLAQSCSARLCPGDDLYKAYRYLVQESLDEVPVVEKQPNGQEKVVYMLRRREIINLYFQILNDD